MVRLDGRTLHYPGLRRTVRTVRTVRRAPLLADIKDWVAFFLLL